MPGTVLEPIIAVTWTDMVPALGSLHTCEHVKTSKQKVTKSLSYVLQV